MTLTIRHGASFGCLVQYLFRQSELWTVDDLSPLDRWLIGILADTHPQFGVALQNYFDSFSSIFGYPKKRRPTVSEFDLNNIVEDVRYASTKDRVEFFKIVSKWGNSKMLAPFIRAGFDLDEHDSNQLLPWLRLSYLSKAARWGNRNTFQTLLHAGACPTWALINLSRNSSTDALPSHRESQARTEMILELAERANPEHLEDEQGYLSILLRTDDIRSYCPEAAERLMRRFFFGRPSFIRPENAPLFNSYILLAILFDLPDILQHFYQRGNAIDANQTIGMLFNGERVVFKGRMIGHYTWLTFAVHFGIPSCVRVFVMNGADITHPDPAGRTALGMAREYCNTQHPRIATQVYIRPYQPPQRLVTEEDDLQTLAILQHTADEHGIITTSDKEAKDHRVVCEPGSRSLGELPARKPLVSSSHYSLQRVG